MAGDARGPCDGLCGNEDVGERWSGSGKTLLVGLAPACPSIFILVFACCEVGAAMLFEPLDLSGVR